MSTIQDMFYKHMKEALNARDDQIIEKIKEHGYEFKNKAELHEFARTRCTIEVHGEVKRVLKVDDKTICYWYETSEMKEIDGTIHIVMGEEPKY